MQVSQCNAKHRFHAPLERVYRAFTDRKAIPRWLAPKGYTLEVVQFDLEKGGDYHLRLKNFFSQRVHHLRGTFLEICPQQSIRFLDHTHSNQMATDVIKSINFHSHEFLQTELTVQRISFGDRSLLNNIYQRGWQDSLNALEELVNERPILYQF